MLLGRARRYGARDGQRGEKAKNALVEILPAGMEMLVTRATRVDEGWEGRRKKKKSKNREAGWPSVGVSWPKICSLNSWALNRYMTSASEECMEGV